MNQIIPFSPPLTGFQPIACAYGCMAKADVPLHDFGVVTLELPPYGETKDSPHEVAHYHQFFDEYYIVVTGSGHVWLNGRKFRISAGDMVFIPAGMAHHFKAGPTGSTLFVTSNYDENDCTELYSFEGFESITSTTAYVSNVGQTFQLGRQYQTPKLFYNERITVYGLSLPAGCEVPTHIVPPHTQELYIGLSGSATLYANYEYTSMQPMSVKSMETGTFHRVLSETDFQAIVFQFSNQSKQKPS